MKNSYFCVAHWSNEQGRLLRFLSFDGSIKWKLMINCKDMNESIMKVSITMWKSRCLFNISFILHELWSRSMGKEFYSQFSPLPFFFFFFESNTHIHTQGILPLCLILFLIYLKSWITINVCDSKKKKKVVHDNIGRNLYNII